MVRVVANGLRDQGAIPGHIIPKTQKSVHDASLLNTQHYKVWIKGKWRNPVVVVANEKEAFRSLSTTISQLTTYVYIYIYSY